MHTVVAGGTGFLGRALVKALVHGGNAVAVLTRGSRQPALLANAANVRYVPWTPDGELGSWAAEIEGATAVINLAGEPIAGRRWSSAQKARIRTSRVLATRSLARAIRSAARPPGVFISGSAVGYYGPRGDEVVTEDSSPGSDFLARVSVEWEDEAALASSPTRVVCVRTGIVLARDGGALSPMLLPFKVGAGGPVGSGRQYWPWIHREDWINLVRWAIDTPQVAGALNGTAPEPVSNAEFARLLGHALHRPAWLRTPAPMLRLVLGEMAGALLLTGQRAIPAKAGRLGFRFRYTRLEDALAALFPAAIPRP